MPYYEVTITASKPVCVKAENEEDARDAAIEFAGDWNRCDAEVEHEYDPNDPKESSFIEEYKQSGDYIES